MNLAVKPNAKTWFRGVSLWTRPSFLQPTLILFGKDERLSLRRLDDEVFNS